MSAFGMKPSFKTKDEYKDWIKGWKALYSDITEQNRKRKIALKDAQRRGVVGEEMAKMHSNLAQDRAMATKAMSLRTDAKIRWNAIGELKRGIVQQQASFPLTVENVRNMDFHFNKKHLEFPDIVPMWIIKAKGTSWYVHHVDCQTPWTTREQPDNPSTKGAIRIKKGTINIDAEGNAVIS
jgi:hypothetical protein